MGAAIASLHPPPDDRHDRPAHPSPLTLPAGTHALCACGLSRNGAFCDGSHQGSGQSPHILKLEKEQTVYLCSCSASAKKPFCDGSHLQLSASTTQGQRPWWKFWADPAILMAAMDCSAAPSVLFIAHGSPMFAIRPGAAGVALTALAEKLGRPRAVLVISPHWETEIPAVGTATRWIPSTTRGIRSGPLCHPLPRQGFSTGSAGGVAALEAAGLPVRTNAQRGLDHGAWVPLRHLFPQADVPIVPLSIQHHGGPGHAFRVGQALAPLAEQDWLIVATGNITHNLRDWQQAEIGLAVDSSYAQRFSDWIHAQLISGNTAACWTTGSASAMPCGPSPATSIYCRCSRPSVPPALAHSCVRSIAASPIT